MSTGTADHIHHGAWRLLPALLVAIAGAAVLVYFVGYLPRVRTRESIDAAAAARKVTPPLVNAATVKLAAANEKLLLPGNVTPITEAYIFARAAGYLKQRYVDIGDRVTAGQKLADIDAPAWMSRYRRRGPRFRKHKHNSARQRTPFFNLRRLGIWRRSPGTGTGS